MPENNGNDVFITLVCDNNYNNETVKHQINDKQSIKKLKKADDTLFNLGIFVSEKGVAISTPFLKKKLQENKENKEKEIMLKIVGEIYDIMDNNESVMTKEEEDKAEAKVEAEKRVEEEPTAAEANAKLNPRLKPTTEAEAKAKAKLTQRLKARRENRERVEREKRERVERGEEEEVSAGKNAAIIHVQRGKEAADAEAEEE